MTFKYRQESKDEVKATSLKGTSKKDPFDRHFASAQVGFGA